MTTTDAVTLMSHVRKHVQRQENGRHTFEGLDTHSWDGKKVSYYRLAVQDREYTDSYTLYAEEAKVISATLQLLDNEAIPMEAP